MYKKLNMKLSCFTITKAQFNVTNTKYSSVINLVHVYEWRRYDESELEISDTHYSEASDSDEPCSRLSWASFFDFGSLTWYSYTSSTCRVCQTGRQRPLTYTQPCPSVEGWFFREWWRKPVRMDTVLWEIIVLLRRTYTHFSLILLQLIARTSAIELLQVSDPIHMLLNTTHIYIRVLSR